MKLMRAENCFASLVVFTVWVLSALIFPSVSLAAPVHVASVSEDLTALSIEELLEQKVYSVTRKVQAVEDSAAAVYVLTAQEIERIGARSIPELLRVVPGVQVARVNAHTWAVSVRGLNQTFVAQLLVLLDGRTVYNSIYGGVYWDQVVLPVEMIERIEVVRGPGGAVWGANAVNGVINIVSKQASEHPESQVVFGAGTVQRGFGSARWSGPLSEGWRGTLFSSVQNHDAYEIASAIGRGQSARDETTSWSAGFSGETNLAQRDSLRIYSNVHAVESGTVFLNPTVGPPYEEGVFRDITDWGSSLLVGWDRALSDGGEVQVQAFYDHIDRHGAQVDFVTDTVDLDIAHRFTLMPHTSLAYGGGWRLVVDELQSALSTLTVDNVYRTTSIFNAFAQAEHTAFRGRLVFTLGSKFEHQDYSGFEVQPSARALWRVTPEHSVWTAVSRAVRTPQRIARDIDALVGVIPTQDGLPIEIVTEGNLNSASEDLLAVELGYRGALASWLSLDTATFYHRYDDLTSFSEQPLKSVQEPQQRSIVHYRFANEMEADSYGIETAFKMQPFDWIRFSLNYAYLWLDISNKAGARNVRPISFEGQNPRHQASVQASIDLPQDVAFDTTVYFVDELPYYGVDAYTRVDFRLAKALSRTVEAALVLQNAFSEAHQEFDATALTPLAAEIERSIFGVLKVEW